MIYWLIFGVPFYALMTPFYAVKHLYSFWKNKAAPSPKELALAAACGIFLGCFALGVFASLLSIKRIEALAIPPTVLVMFSFGLWSVLKNYDAGKGGFVRGASLLDRARFGKADEDSITFGGVPIPRELESLSFAVVGSPGSGKSLAVNSNLSVIRRRGERAIVFDAGGEAMSGWMVEGDVIINPFDARSVNWSPFAELEDEWGAGAIAAALIGEAESPDERQWVGHAVNVLTGILERVWRRGNPCNADLIYFATLASPEEMKVLLEGHAAAAYYMPGNERFLAGILATIGGRLASFQWLNPKAGTSAFSVSKWIAENNSNWIWVPYREDHARTLKPIRRCVCEIAATALLAQETQLSRRIWFVADEFASLGKVEKLLDLASKGRKKGACLLVAFQSIAAIEAGWERTGRDVLKNCLQTFVAFRTADGATCKFLEQEFGETEFQREETSESNGEGRNSKTTAIRHVRQSLLLASQFQMLAPRNGYLKIAGMPVCTVEVPIITPPYNNPSFVKREPPAPLPSKVAAGVDTLKEFLQTAGGE